MVTSNFLGNPGMVVLYLVIATIFLFGFTINAIVDWYISAGWLLVPVALAIFVTVPLIVTIVSNNSPYVWG